MSFNVNEIRGNQTERRILELQRRAYALEPLAEEARKKLAGEDPDWERRKTSIEAEISKIIMAYSEEDPTRKSHARMAQLQMLQRELEHPKNMVRDLERTREALTATMAEKERVDSLREQAGRERESKVSSARYGRG